MAVQRSPRQAIMIGRVFRLLYLISVPLCGWMVLFSCLSASKDAESLVLRAEIAVLDRIVHSPGWTAGVLAVGAVVVL